MHLRALLIGSLLLVALVPQVAAHPPAFDPHNACQGLPAMPILQAPPMALVVGTLSYVAPPGTSLPCPGVAEWGSHAPPCPPPPFVGPAPGKFCGPVVPPGGGVICTWLPVLNTVPTGLVLGFDGFAPPGPGMDGLVNLVTSGEGPVTAPLGVPIPPVVSGYLVFNPYPVPARVIAFPTATGPFPPGLLAPGDLNLVGC